MKVLDPERTAPENDNTFGIVIWAEYPVVWLSDVESFISREAVAACIEGKTPEAEAPA